MSFSLNYMNKNIEYGFLDNNIPNSTHSYNHLDPKIKLDNIRILKKYVHYDNLAVMVQTHSNKIVVIDDVSQKQPLNCDAVITKHSQIALCVQTADCVPILLFDEKNMIIAAIHAGWRGAVKDIVELTIDEMLKIGGSQDAAIALIGPYIKMHSYEIKQDMIEEISKQDNKALDFIVYQDDKTYFALGDFVKMKLSKCGIGNIYDLNIDTYTHPACFSFRRFTHDKNYRYGSLISYIALKSESI